MKKTIQLNLKLTEKQAQRLEYYCERTELTKQQVIRELLNNYLPLWYIYHKPNIHEPKQKLEVKKWQTTKNHNSADN